MDCVSAYGDVTRWNNVGERIGASLNVFVPLDNMSWEERAFVFQQTHEAEEAASNGIKRFGYSSLPPRLNNFSCITQFLWNSASVSEN